MSIAVAITGTIGSGKSFVGNILREQGFAVLDLDKTAKEVRDNEAKPEIIKLFQTDDPKKISDAIFKDNSKLVALNSLMHPLIFKRMDNFLKTHENDPITFVEVPLLYELGWEKYFDYTICVSANLKTMIERLVNFRGMDIDKAIDFSENQLKGEDKAKRADFVIDNNVDMSKEDVSNQVKEVVNKCLTNKIN